MLLRMKTGATLKLSIKMFEVNNLLRELLLATRQKTELRNTIEKNMSIDRKLSKIYISKIIQSG